MKLMTALTVAGLLLATGFGGASAVSADDEAVDRRNRETTELIARLNGFDAATYAKTAAASGDHRLVVSDQTLQGSHTLGLACVAESRSQRSLLFGEHGLGNARLEKAFFQAAARFNRTMVATPRYPDRDICIPADTPIKSPDLSTRTAEQDLRPHVTGLSTAVRAQDVAATQRAISSGVNVDAPDEYGFTPLMWAIQRKNWSMAELLLAAGADPFASQGESVSSPLTIAVGTGELPLVENVLKSQVKGVASSTQPLGTPNYSDRPARLAVLLNRVDILERLIAFKAVPDARDTQGWRWTIQTAFKKNCTRCVEVILGYAGSHIGYSTDFQQIVSEEMESNNPEHLLILSRGASNSLAYSGATALALSAAADGNNAAVIRTILKSGQELNLLSETELQELITTIKAGRVGQLSHYMSLSAKRRKELNAAIAANNLSAISSSLPKTANLDQQNTLTPLMYAAMLSKGPTVEYLLKRGSHLEAQIGYLAISYADEAPAGYALTSPTPTEPEENHWGDEGRNALEFAITFGNLSAIPVLTRAGADPEAKSSAWPLLLEMARITANLSTSRQIRLIDVLLATSPRERRHLRANMLLSSAANWDQQKLYRHLIAAGAKPCENAGSYQLPIVAAAANGDLAGFLLFVKGCDGWSPTSSIAETSLKEALRGTHLFDGGSLDVIRYLLKLHVTLPEPYLGLTPLGWAVSSGNVELVKLILATGTDVNEVCEGRTALEAARGGPHGELLETLLRTLGAKTALELGLKPAERPFPFF